MVRHTVLAMRRIDAMSHLVAMSHWVAMSHLIAMYHWVAMLYSRVDPLSRGPSIGSYRSGAGHNWGMETADMVLLCSTEVLRMLHLLVLVDCF